MHAGLCQISRVNVHYMKNRRQKLIINRRSFKIILEKNVSNFCNLIKFKKIRNLAQVVKVNFESNWITVFKIKKVDSEVKIIKFFIDLGLISTDTLDISKIAGY